MLKTNGRELVYLLTLRSLRLCVSSFLQAEAQRTPSISKIMKPACDEQRQNTRRPHLFPELT
jgi:hypothetical protein